jgi:hypothetical protein|tara:strand:+ start:769 stop:1017 length:249 start_codon:yes stop_codon:yes gene_type:complete
MIDKKISLGSILTIASVLIGAAISYGVNSNKVENINTEQLKVVKRVKSNEENIVNLKISVAKIETQLDDRFDRLEDIIMDLE